MYGISSNMRFIPMYLRKEKNRTKMLNKKYNITDTSISNLVNILNVGSKNKYYVSKIFLCKYIN